MHASIRLCNHLKHVGYCQNIYKIVNMKHNRFNNTLDTMIYVETQFGKNHQQHATLFHSSQVVPCERPTLLKVTIHIVKCDLD